MNTLSPAKSRKPASLSARAISMTAMLAAVSYLLAFVEFPVPLSPSFARMDLSDLPALIGAFAFGPLTGLLIELVKNALQLCTSSTSGVGEIANFLMGASYVVAAGLIYKHRKTKNAARFACILASVVMGIAAALANYFILLPLFENFMPLDQLIASFAEFLPFIHTKLDVVLFNAFPFNLFKGLVIGGVTMLMGCSSKMATFHKLQILCKQNIGTLHTHLIISSPIEEQHICGSGYTSISDVLLVVSPTVKNDNSMLNPLSLLSLPASFGYHLFDVSFI